MGGGEVGGYIYTALAFVMTCVMHEQIYLKGETQ